MRKICAMLSLICVLLCGCDPQTYYFDSTEIAENAVKIELVICENSSPVIVNVTEDTVLHFDIDHATIVKELEQEKKEEFARELSAITFHKEPKSVNAPIGYTLLIHMQNQEVIVLSCTVVDGTAYGMASVFSDTGEFVGHVAQFAEEPRFRSLLTKYFQL